MAHKFQLVLKDKIKLSEGTHHFVFTADQAEVLEYKAGQFISLHIMSEGKEHRRNYSIANSPNKENIIELAMAYLPNGLASSLLANLKTGETVQASGPYGQFILKDEILPQRYILIGTGTGITPYRSMLPDLSLLLDKGDLEVVILQGVRKRADLLYADEFVNFANQYQNVIFKACYSRDLPAQALDFEVSGYVQDHLEQLQVRDSSDIAYLCGNPNMVDATFTKLQELGLDRSRIRREKYISSK